MALVGKALFVNITSSKFEQLPLVMVHLKVTTLPALRPVTVVVGEVVLVMVAAPDWTVHNPVPITAAFPARVKVLVLHCS